MLNIKRIIYGKGRYRINRIRCDGQNLALNLANKGWKVVVWNRTVPGKEENVVEHFIANRAKGKGIIGSNELTDFVEALKTPRVIHFDGTGGALLSMKLTGKLFPLMENG